MNRTPVLRSLLLGLLVASPGVAREAKEYDADVHYEESDLPHYDLPPVLVAASGKRVVTAEEWHSVRSIPQQDREPEGVHQDLSIPMTNSEPQQQESKVH